MRADGSEPRQLTSNAARDAMPAISPDGSRIAFVSDRGGAGADLWRIYADGSGAGPLLSAPGDERDPQYFPTGGAVVVSSRHGPDLDVGYVVDGGTLGLTFNPITLHALDETAAALQPDGVRLAYARAGDIQTAYHDGTDEFPLAVSPAAEDDPAFSPDGTRVAYTADGALIVAAAGGLNPAPLALPGLGPVSDPDWAVAADEAPPETTITKAPRGRTERRGARFRFRSSEPGSTFRCKLDRRAYEDCDSPQTYRRLAPKRHRFRVLAVDPAGNADPSPARDRFRILAGP